MTTKNTKKAEIVEDIDLPEEKAPDGIENLLNLIHGTAHLDDLIIDTLRQCRMIPVDQFVVQMREAIIEMLTRRLR